LLKENAPKTKIYSKIPKEGIILQNSVKLKIISTHLAKIRISVKSPKKVSFSHI
jgi:sRNA-binding carbon storage regulator CsrA